MERHGVMNYLADEPTDGPAIKELTPESSPVSVTKGKPKDPNPLLAGTQTAMTLPPTERDDYLIQHFSKDLSVNSRSFPKWGPQNVLRTPRLSGIYILNSSRTLSPLVQARTGCSLNGQP